MVMRIKNINSTGNGRDGVRIEGRHDVEIGNLVVANNGGDGLNIIESPEIAAVPNAATNPSDKSLSLRQKFTRLSLVEKLGILGSIASLIGIPIAFYLASSPPPSQTAIGNGNTQIGSVGGNITVNPPPQPRSVDPQISAQTMRTVAETHRENARFHMPSPPPPVWLEAEALFQRASAAYRQGNYVVAYQGFDQTQRIYLDLYSEFKAAGH